MRVFWAILVVVVLVAAGALLLGGRGNAQNGVVGPAPIGRVAEEDLKPPPAAKPPAETKPAGAKPGGVPKAATQAPAPAPSTAPAAAVPVPGAPKPAEGDGSQHTASAPEGEAPPKTTETGAGTPTHTTREGPARSADTGSSGAVPAGSKSASPDTAPASGGDASPFGADADAKIVKQADGSYLVDDKYVIKGKGTAEAPLEITWDYLISAQESYQPRLGKKKLPGRLSMLNGKEVKITGYVAFPVMAQEQTEMLMMLNQWDGCCIGVPPTAYDAIEVKLDKPAVGMDRLATYGSVRGKMKVEPYLVKDWLVSLYAMDGAVVTRE